MENLRVVIVEPEYEVNLGSVCRAMANFGYGSLYLVSPKCDPSGFEARMYSKHALPILEQAKIVKSLKQATAGCSRIIGTTGVLRRHKKTIRDPIALRKLPKLALGGKVAVVFGREGIGLSQKEIDQCDMLLHVETHEKYPVMNLSHAVAVVLYAFSSLGQKPIEQASRSELRQLERFFAALVEGCGKKLRNPHKVKIAFRRIMQRSAPSKIEAVSVLGVMRLAADKIKK